MTFTEMRNKLIKHFDQMVKDVDYLYEVEVDKDEMWNLYLDSFPAGTNEIYRERREHDCSCCRQFIKSIGNAVVIKNYNVTTIWDFNTGDEAYQPVLDALSDYVRSHLFSISSVYLSPCNKIGCSKNYEELENGEVKVWTHFYLDLPDRFVRNGSETIPEIKGRFRDTRNVFKRSLDEITTEALDVVLELISSNTLYKGEEWAAALNEFRKHKIAYDSLSTYDLKEIYTWEKSVKVGAHIGRIRNHSIGTLLTNISEGMDLDLAVKKYEQIVAPSNYKRPKAIFTKKMLEDAKKKIEELGYMDSLKRRFATLDDITVNNILFSNKDAAKRIVGADDLFSQMEKEVAINPKQFSKVEEIPVKDFITNVLPTAKEIEVFVENKHRSNFVSMIAPLNPDAKTMFKWNNGMSWAYTGNITDSEMKENVKAAGGKVDGVLRFSIQWNEDGKDNCDLDAHCIEPKPTGREIYYSTYKKPRVSLLGGQLDVDIIHPNGKVAVENITWADKSKMIPGVYSFYVHQFNGSARNGFRAEIEFDGEIHSFDYDKPMRYGERVWVAEVTMDTHGNFTIKEKVSSSSAMTSKEMWGVSTNQFTPVSVVSYSPNYFDEQDGIGHRHLFFFLKGCVNPEEPNGMFNEFLKNELMEHKRVFEALGAKCHVVDADDQLSGVGFSMTKRAELVVKVKGATERVMKIKF